MGDEKRGIRSAAALWPARMASLSLSYLAALKGYKPLTILIYHSVLAEPDPLRPGVPSAREFEAEMQLLSACFTPLPLVEALGALRNGTLPKRAVCVTFDDGYADNQAVALPILERYGIPATVFVSSGYLDGGRMWNDSIIETVRKLGGQEIDLACFGLGVKTLRTVEDQNAAIEQIIETVRHWESAKRLDGVEQFQACVSNLPDDLMLTGAQLQDLSARGIEIGGHTRNHPILSCMSDTDAFSEIADGKKDLEERLGQPIVSFAYPNGSPGIDYTQAHVQMVRDLGFNCALSTQMGVCTASSQPFELPRFTPWNKMTLGFTGQMWANSFGLLG